MKKLLLLGILGFSCNTITIIAKEKLKNVIKEDDIQESITHVNGSRFIRGIIKTFIGYHFLKFAFIARQATDSMNFNAPQTDIESYIKYGLTIGMLGNGYMFYRGLFDMYYAFEELPASDEQNIKHD